MSGRRVLAAGLLGSAVACAHLLGLDPRGHPFEHRAHVLEGIPCVECHAGVREAKEDEPLHLPAADRCIGCHAKPHDRRNCRDCHGLPWIEQRAEAAKRHLVFSHVSHLPVVHDNCARCHVGVAEDRSPLLPPMIACFGCHAHEDQFRVRDCEGCHADLPDEGARPESHAVHGLDFARAHGPQASSARDLCDTCHGERFCASCHGVSLPLAPRQAGFDRPSIVSFHRGAFLARHAREARIDSGLCSTCHLAETCDRCHAGAGLSASSGISGSPGALVNPHPPGWVSATLGKNAHGREARRDPASCAGCHGGAGEALCVSCHQVGGIGGTVHPPGWSSPRDKLADHPCRMCHAGAR